MLAVERAEAGQASKPSSRRWTADKTLELPYTRDLAGRNGMSKELFRVVTRGYPRQGWNRHKRRPTGTPGSGAMEMGVVCAATCSS